jgi:hypothetical protein
MRSSPFSSNKKSVMWLKKDIPKKEYVGHIPNPCLFGMDFNQQKWRNLK